VVRFNPNALGKAFVACASGGAALTVDPAAPQGIGEISAPMLFVL